MVSALVFGGGSAALIRSAWQAGEFIPLVSSATASELVRVLAYPKFRLAAHEQEELLADYLPYALAVRIFLFLDFCELLRGSSRLSHLV